MSTAGKVLTVLVTLSILLWIALAALVADLNRNWGEALDKQRKEFARLREEIGKAENDLIKLKLATDVEQDATTKDVTRLRADIAARERVEIEIKEALAAAQLQLAKVEAEVKDAQAQVEIRQQEKQGTEKALADAQAAVAQLRTQNAELLAELTRLRDEFKATLAENKELLARYQAAGRPKSANGNRTRITSIH
ncbi:MAG: hypothetical protein IRY99_28230 [Isosphaeraceae bacterium]|nr:hypothetical protein [Isosphaeraceae bacterium]